MIPQNIVLQEKKFQSKKLMTNDLILKLDRCKFSKESELVRECGNYLTFSYQEHIQSKDKRRKLKQANFCKFRFCSMCNWRRNLNINKELLEAFESIEADRTVSYLFLTLTIPNTSTSDLKATVSHLNKSFERMTKTVAYKKAVIGHFKALEIVGDKTPADEVHPHLHIILIVPKSYLKSRNYLSQAKWTEMWKKATRTDLNDDLIVHIQKIKSKITRAGKVFSELQSAIFEVAKYSVKHTELIKRNDKDFSLIINQTKNMRFFSTGGFLKDKINLIKCDEDLIRFKEETESLWIEIEEEIYSWRCGDYYKK